MAIAQPAPAPKQASLTAAWIFIGAPLLLAALCLSAKFGLVALPGGVRVAIIFLLLVSFLLTGMPVSIALGLTVLIFIFTLTTSR